MVVAKMAVSSSGIQMAIHCVNVANFCKELGGWQAYLLEHLSAGDIIVTLVRFGGPGPLPIHSQRSTLCPLARIYYASSSTNY